MMSARESTRVRECTMETDRSNSSLARATEIGLQPTIIILVLAIWSAYPESAAVYPLLLLGVQLLLGLLESRIPARRDWVQPARERMVNVSIVVIILMGTIAVAAMYESVLSAPLTRLRESAHLDIWPAEWPLLAQVLLAFLLSEFVVYWLHRAQHRWGFFWRLSGHGFHHSIKHLAAINFSVNHPFEIFVLVVPAAVVELLFGAGVAAAGAAVLGGVQASIVHANLRLNSKWIGFLFTTNEFHIHHHSVVLEESNTNYGCSAIVWDRVFGTFARAPTDETGIGPTEPGLWDKLKMPFREPADSVVAP